MNFILFFCRMLTGKEEVKGSDDEEDKKSKQGNFGPRRKFQWTDHIRLVCVCGLQTWNYPVSRRNLHPEIWYNMTMQVVVAQ